MAARAMWKGVLHFGGLQLPVKLYAAIEDRAVHFRLLHRQDLEPVRQSLVNPETEEIVPLAATSRAYVTESGDRVLLQQQELETLEPEPSRDIQVLSFLPRHVIDHRWYDRPYFLGPDGESSHFFSLADALEEMQVEGLVHWVMRNKDYVGALQLYQGYPMLMSLHHAEEVIPVEALSPPQGPPLDTRELQLAKQLIEMLAAEFSPQEYHDEYRQRVLKMLAAKAQGKRLKLRVPQRRERGVDIRHALEASIQQARKHA